MALQSLLLALAPLPTMKKLTLTVSLMAAASLSFGAPAHAAPVDCSTGGLGGSAAWNITLLTALGSDGCFTGDKVYSDFSFTGISTGFFGFTISGKDHTFSGSSLNFTGSSFTYSYKVSLFNAVPGQEFKSYSTDASGSATTTSLDYSKDLSTTTPVTGPSTSFAPGGGQGPIVIFAPGEVGPVTFSSTLTLNGGKIDTITDTLSQKLDGIEPTPGPLSILGAGAAFGFSRRLRSRIKQVA